MTIAIALVALLVGVPLGIVGVGGLLLPPALHALTPLSLHAAMATALFTFVFTGIVGTGLFQRRGSIAWDVAVPLCIGGAACGYLGGWVSAWVPARPLALLLGAVIVASGVWTLRGAASRDGPPRRWRTAVLLVIGGVAGFGSGLVGVGGPALSVPLLVLAGFPALTAIGASQVIQILAAGSGTLAHLHDGLIDWSLAAGLTALEVAGVAGGCVLAHAVDAGVLRRIVAVLCLVVGSALLWRWW